MGPGRQLVQCVVDLLYQVYGTERVSQGTRGGSVGIGVYGRGLNTVFFFFVETILSLRPLLIFGTYICD